MIFMVSFKDYYSVMYLELFFYFPKSKKIAFWEMKYYNIIGKMMKLIKRNFYLDKLINTMNTSDIKVITGIRCAEKSKLLDEV